MPCKVFLISVVCLLTFVSGNRLFTESLNHDVTTTNIALEQNESNVTSLLSQLNTFRNQMKTIKDTLRNGVDAIIKEVENKLSSLIQWFFWMDQIGNRYQSCLSIRQRGNIGDGVYYIYPSKDGVAIPVYCDMTTDGGGWTVFQRRQDGSVDFYRGWEDYKHGFGKVDGEFWLGNDHIADLNNECCNELRVDMADFDGNQTYAHYDSFKVLPESENYTLVVGGYSGDAGDSLDWHNNNAFSTKDRDNDLKSSGNCASQYKGAWWYNSCHTSNLNGLYLRDPNTASGEGVQWNYWRGKAYSLKTTEMKLRKIL